jgi:hypothetical protein
LLLVTAGTAVVMMPHGDSRERAGRKLLQQVEEKYASLTAYGSTGTTREDLGNGLTVTGTFDLRLGRPNLYRLDYDVRSPNFTNRGTAWSAGNGDYFWNGGTNVVRDPLATPGGWLSDLGHGVSLGADAFTAEAFFLLRPPGATPGDAAGRVPSLSPLRARARLEPDESIRGVDCRVLSAEADWGSVKLWIGKEDSLIHQSQYTLKGQRADENDADVAAMFGASPLPLPLPRLRREINEARRKADREMKPVTIVFSKDTHTPGMKSMTFNPTPPSYFVFTQNHEHIAENPQYAPADFAR